MAEENDKYRNPEAPPGYQKPLPYPEILVDQNPDAPPGLYKFETVPNNTKLYIDCLHFVLDLKLVLEDENVTKDDSDFVIMTTDEESELSEEIISKPKCDLTKVKAEPGEIVSEDSEIIIASSTSETSKASFHKKTKKARQTRSKRSKRSESYSSDSSSHSYISSKKKYKRKKRSRSSSSTTSPHAHVKEEEDCKISIKLEDIEQPKHLFGSYHCELCNIKMTSSTTYESHMSGKRHMKTAKAKNVADTVLKSIPPTDSESRYPKPLPGIRRVPSREKSKIQDIVEQNLDKPCPALHEVTEIQGLSETSYYCNLCDSPCSCNCIIPHLNGYKHRLNCLKHFRRDIYERHNYEPKYKFEIELNKILRSIQKAKGMGKIKVEKEISVDEGEDSYSLGRRDIYQPSTSFDHSSSVPDNFDESGVRDMSKPGYYCKICQAPMNSIEMWENHCSGKRHLSNMKKHPGCVPSKLKSIALPNKPSMLLRSLKNEDRPVVGLDHIKEIQNPETQLPSYQCLLCSASFTRIDIRDHLLTEKHRRKYLQQIQHPELKLLEMMPIPDAHTNNLVENICEGVEREYGRGHPEVRVIKNTFKP